MLHIGEVAATTDLWKEIHTQSEFISFSLHYLTELWVLKKRILFLKPLNQESKTGENIERLLLSTFSNFNFNEEQFNNITFVSDQGPNIKSALAEYDRMNCVCHVINLILKTTFAIEEKKDSVIFKTLKTAKELITYLKQSGLAKKLKRGLTQAVEIRFNTNLKMIKSIYIQMNEIQELLTDIGKENDYHLNEEILKEIIDFLEVFEEAIKEFECDQRVTIDKVLL